MLYMSYLWCHKVQDEESENSHTIRQKKPLQATIALNELRFWIIYTSNYMSSSTITD